MSEPTSPSPVAAAVEGSTSSPQPKTVSLKSPSTGTGKATGNTPIPLFSSQLKRPLSTPSGPVMSPPIKKQKPLAVSISTPKTPKVEGSSSAPTSPAPAASISVAKKSSSKPKSAAKSASKPPAAPSKAKTASKSKKKTGTPSSASKAASGAKSKAKSSAKPKPGSAPASAEGKPKASPKKIDKAAIQAKMVKLKTSEKELKDRVDKLDRERTRVKTRIDELTAVKFPVKDELIAELDPSGAPLRDLPPIISWLDCSPDVCQDVLTTWNFLSTFSQQLLLKSISLDSFLALLKFSGRESTALSEVFSAPLRLLLADSEISAKLSASIPKAVSYTYRSSDSAADSSGNSNNNSYSKALGIDVDDDAALESIDFDTQFNGLRLIPKKIKVDLVDALRWQAVLRAIVVRLDNVKRIRKYAADNALYYNQSNASEVLSSLIADDPSVPPQQLAVTTQSRSKAVLKGPVDKDALLQLTGNPFPLLQTLREALKELETKEMHQLPLRLKLSILQVLCDACFDTHAMRQQLKRNAEERANKLTAMRQQMKEEKSKVREVGAALRDRAVKKCREVNRKAAEAKEAAKLAALAAKEKEDENDNNNNSDKAGKKSSGAKKLKPKAPPSKPGSHGKSNSNINSSTSAKDPFEPTPTQIAAMLEELLLLESVGIDEVVDNVVWDNEEGGVLLDDPVADEEEAMLASLEVNRRVSVAMRARVLERQRAKQERQQRYLQVAIASERLKHATEMALEKELRAAVKLAVKAGLRWKQGGKDYCTELMKKAYKALADIDARAKETRAISDMEKTLAAFPTRLTPIGTDRHNREYFCFPDDDQPRLFVKIKCVQPMPLQVRDNSLHNQYLTGCISDTHRRMFASRYSQTAYEWGFYSSSLEHWELYNALDERGEREGALKRLILAKFNIVEPQVLYLKTGSAYVGRRVRRVFGSKTVIGTIVGWLPKQGKDVAVWHVLHTDGDEEDLDEAEVEEALVAETLQPPSADAAGSRSGSSSDLVGLGTGKGLGGIRHSGSATSLATSYSNNTMDVVGAAAVDSSEKMDVVASDSASKEDEEPDVVRNFTNSFKRFPPMRPHQLGTTGLIQELLRVEGLLLEGLKARGGFTREGRKIWEQSVKNACTVEDLRHALQELEAVVRDVQEAPDRRDDEVNAKQKAAERAEMSAEGWVFEANPNSTNGSRASELLGKSVRRFFHNFGASDGVIAAYLPADKNDGMEIWRLEHADGDREDVDFEVAVRAARYFEENAQDGEEDDGDDNQGSHASSEGGDSDDEAHNNSDDDASDGGDESDDDNEAAEENHNAHASASEATLWPTYGMRQRWLECVQRCRTIGEVALALQVFALRARQFDVMGEDPLDVLMQPQTQRRRQQTSQFDPSSYGTGQANSKGRGSHLKGKGGAKMLSPQKKVGGRAVKGHPVAASVGIGNMRPTREAAAKVRSYAEL